MVPFSTLAIGHGELQILTSCVLLHLSVLVLIGEKRMNFQFYSLCQYQWGNSWATGESNYSLKVLLTFIWYWAAADNVDSLSRKIRKHLFTQPHPTALSRASSLYATAHIFKSTGASFGFIYYFSKISVGPATNDSDELVKLFKFTLFVNTYSTHKCSLSCKIQVTADYSTQTQFGATFILEYFWN